MKNEDENTHKIKINLFDDFVGITDIKYKKNLMKIENYEEEEDLYEDNLFNGKIMKYHYLISKKNIKLIKNNVIVKTFSNQDIKIVIKIDKDNFNENNNKVKKIQKNLKKFNIIDIDLKQF